MSSGTSLTSRVAYNPLVINDRVKADYWQLYEEDADKCIAEMVKKVSEQTRNALLYGIEQGMEQRELKLVCSYAISNFIGYCHRKNIPSEWTRRMDVCIRRVFGADFVYYSKHMGRIHDMSDVSEIPELILHNGDPDKFHLIRWSDVSQAMRRLKANQVMSTAAIIMASAFLTEQERQLSM